jgi:polyisoprenoid-binding protein YceI
MRNYLSSALLVATLWSSQAAAATTEWDINVPHTTLSFVVKHMKFTNVRGTFQSFNGTLNLDDKDPTKSTVDITIDAKSIDTRNEKRDAHLKSADFFDVEKTPTITFKSTKIEKHGKGYKVHGDLTMRGVTKPAVLDVTQVSPPVKAPEGDTRIGVTATTKVHRKDWGLNWNMALEAGGVLVSEDVTLEIDAEFSQKATAAPTTAAQTAPATGEPKDAKTAPATTTPATNTPAAAPAPGAKPTK